MQHDFLKFWPDYAGFLGRGSPSEIAYVRNETLPKRETILTSDSKPLFREHFRDYVEDTLGEAFDSLHDVRRSKLMARFFAERVLFPRNPTLLPFGDEDLEACIVDGKGDQGIDFISREDGVVLIIQAKFSGGKKQTKRPYEDPTDFDSFRNVLNRLRGYQELDMSQALREVAAEINWETDRFQLYYVTLRQLSANQEDLAKKPLPVIHGLSDLAERTELDLLDENRLNLELRDTLSLDQQESKTMRLRFSPNHGEPAWIRLGDEDTGRACYIGRISGAQLANLFTQHKSRLFSLNIRNYIGDNVTNKNIRTTAVDSSEDFFFFNNGISALATRVEPDEQDSTSTTLLCQDLSIVNGAQTIRSLHKAHLLDSIAVRKAHVLVRLTEFSAKKNPRRTRVSRQCDQK